MEYPKKNRKEEGRIERRKKRRGTGSGLGWAHLYCGSQIAVLFRLPLGPLDAAGGGERVPGGGGFSTPARLFLSGDLSV